MKTLTRAVKKNSRRLLVWWRRCDRRYGLWWRLANGLFAALLLAGVVMPIVQQLVQANSYRLSADTLKLVGATDESLASQLKYNAQTGTYEFNKDAVKSDSANPFENLKAQVGTAKGGNDKNLYALDVPQDITKGTTYYDTNSGLSFSLVPEFKASSGREEQGHLVFPLSGGAQAIYTLKNNGLKEDVVMQRVTTDTVQFSYELKLPNTLQARIIPDSGGNIGIYSADPALFGNISYGSDKDRAAVEKARENADKTYLVFGLPAPTIRTANGTPTAASARFELQGNQLTVVASGLRSIGMPFTIDPSVTVTSTSDFLNGNNEGNIDFSTSGQITRGGLTGATVSGGWGTTNNFTTAREQAGSVTYNGYLYILGGTVYGGSNLDDVQYVQINSDGTLGTWADAGDPTNILYSFDDLQAVAYSGYMYLIGGYQSVKGVGTSKTQVTYAPINSNGTLGTWQTVNSLPAGVTGAGTVAYNNYIYVAGGGPSGYGGGGYYNTVYYAAINADGTLGTWNSASNLLDTLGTSQAVAYNGYIYVIGGANGSGYINTVEYARINSDGSLGAFAQTTPFSCGARYGQFDYVYNGYLYLGGGVGANGCGSVGGLHTDVQYVQINANGTLGTWQQTASLSASYGLRYVVGAAYNGYLYAMSGRNQAGTADSNVVQYAKVDPAGTVGTFNTLSSTPIPAARTGGSMVAYNGYLYVVGGDNGSTVYTDVLYASINSDGTLGSWASTGGTSLGGSGLGRTHGAAVAYRGRIFVIGGCTALPCSTAANDIIAVKQAVINSDGTVGNWATVTSPSATARYDAAMTIYNDHMYWAGGINGSTYLSDTWMGSITGPTSMSGWATSTSLPSARASMGSAMYNGYWYLAGGNSGGSDLNTVAYAQLGSTPYAPSNTAGSIGSWTTTTSGAGNFTTARSGLMLAADKGYLYIAGGHSGATYYNDTQYIQIGSSGGISGNWTTGVSFTTARTVSASTIANGYMYIAGGDAGATPFTDVQYAPVNNGGSGTTSSFTSLSNMFSPTRYDHATVAYNGYLYVMGGCSAGAPGSCSTYQSDVQYAAICTGSNTTTAFTTNCSGSSTPGTTSSWNTGQSFTTGVYGLTAAVYKGYLYIMGGMPSSGTPVTTVQYAAICTGSNTTTAFTTNCSGSSTPGTTSSWNTGQSFTTGRYNLAGVAYNGYVYIAGGASPHKPTANTYNDVQYAAICTGSNTTTAFTTNCSGSSTPGSISSWNTNSTSFTTTRAGHAALISNGYMYIIGGGNTGGTYYSDVQYAPVNSNGTVGTWAYTVSFNTPRGYLSSFVLNGFLYIMGGYDGTSYYGDVQYAPLSSSGPIGQWSSITGSSTTGAYQGAAYYNGYAYLTGGYNGSMLTSNSFATINSIPRVGRYSKLINLNTSGVVNVPTYNPTPVNANSSLTYTTASATGQFGISGNCTLATGISQYVYVSFVLDDSLTAGFPDSTSSNTSNIQDFTITYNAIHPPPNQRLRGGKTIQQGSSYTNHQSPLDTCAP